MELLETLGGQVRAGSAAGQPGFSSRHCHFPALCFNKLLILLFLSFPIWKMDLMVPGTSELIHVNFLGQRLTHSVPIVNKLS